MTRILIFVLSVIAALPAFAQYPENRVPNPGFENGGGSTNCTFTSEEDFNDAIEAWWASGYSLNVYFRNDPTPDWGGVGGCGSCGYAGSKHVMLGCDGDDGYEAVLAKLKSSLRGGKSYIFKIKVRAYAGNGLIHCEVKNIEHGETTEYQNIGAFEPNGTTESCKWIEYQNIFYVPDGTEWFWIYIKKVKSNGAATLTAIDDVFITEYCPELMERQNVTWTAKSGLEEANYIEAGNAVSTFTSNGDFVTKDQSQLTFKAGTQVSLMPGTTVERGSDFVAKIAPCGKPCGSPDVAMPTSYTICDNQCINLSGGSSLGMSFVWSSPTPELLQYLSSVTASHPVFCPPPNLSHGVYVYTVTIKNLCGETVTKTITINYEPTSNPNSVINVISSNLDTKPDAPSLTFKPDPHAEKIIVDIMDCEGNVLRNDIFVDGQNFNRLEPFTWSNAEYYDPCACYKIVVKSKNYCYAEWTEKTFSWNRNRSLSGIEVANASICRDGKRYICFKGTGVDYLKVKIWNNWQTAVPIFDETIQPGSTCFEIPYNWSNAGHYSYEVTVVGCDGSIVYIEKQPFAVGPCHGNLIGDTTEWDGDSYNSGVVYTNPETGKKDSVYSFLNPNPVTEYSTISYHLPIAGYVKITLHNSNFEQTAELLNSPDNFPSGDHQTQFTTQSLVNGINYYKIEYSTGQGTSIHIKRFTAIK